MSTWQMWLTKKMFLAGHFGLETLKRWWKSISAFALACGIILICLCLLDLNLISNNLYILKIFLHILVYWWCQNFLRIFWEELLWRWVGHRMNLKVIEQEMHFGHAGLLVTQEQFCRTACPTNHPKMKLDGIIENTQPFLCFLSYF